MAEEIDPIVLQATKDSLGKYIKKPPLSDKLLGKPPFKFLHDIFSVVSVNRQPIGWSLHSLLLSYMDALLFDGNCFESDCYLLIV